MYTRKAATSQLAPTLPLRALRGREMAWIKVDVRASTDPRLLSVGLAGRGLWLDAMCYCGMHQTDGLIPQAIVTDPKLAARLVTAGLWAQTPTGYEVRDYLVLNSTQEQITRARAEKAARMAALRAARGTDVTSNRRVTDTLDRRSKIVDRRFKMVDGRSTEEGPPPPDPKPTDPEAYLKWVEAQSQG